MEADRINEIRITLIGAGNMAEALVNGIVESGTVPARQVCVSDINEERLEYFAEKFGVLTSGDNAVAVERANVCVLAVKPQVISEVLAELEDFLNADCLVISIAAGLQTKRLQAMLPAKQRLVRVMPNTPALIGLGMSALCRGENATDDDMNIAELLFGAVGKTVRIEEEDMDALTAVSGSGPAYVFYLMENMIRAGVDMGLSPEVARLLTCSTVEGAVRLMIETDSAASDLRASVTSKGGTTAAAIECMDAGGMDTIITNALRAARNRSVELSE